MGLVILSTFISSKVNMLIALIFFFKALLFCKIASEYKQALKINTVVILCLWTLTFAP